MTGLVAIFLFLIVASLISVGIYLFGHIVRAVMDIFNG